MVSQNTKRTYEVIEGGEKNQKAKKRKRLHFNPTFSELHCRDEVLEIRLCHPPFAPFGLRSKPCQSIIVSTIAEAENCIASGRHRISCIIWSTCGTLSRIGCPRLF